jgi:hypothetical protein
VKVSPIAPRRADAIRIVNPEFIVLRALQSQSAPGSSAASIYGKRVYFKPSERILGLWQLVPETASVQRTPQGTFLLLINTMTEGAKALRAWTAAHLNQQVACSLRIA